MDESNRLVAILATVTVALSMVVGAVALFGSDPALTRLISYVSSAVPVIIGFAFMARRQEENTSKTNKTEEHVGTLSGNLNGKLDARFQEIKDRIDSVDAKVPALPDAESDTSTSED